MAGKGTEVAGMYVAIGFDFDEFTKDMKKAARDVKAQQDQLSTDMKRSKIAFAIDTSNKNWAEDMFGKTSLGKIDEASRKITTLTKEIALQQQKVNVSRVAWNQIYNAKGATNTDTVRAEKSYLNQQMALASLKTEMNAVNGDRMAAAFSMIKTGGMVATGAVLALSAAFAQLASMAAQWGEAIHSVMLETGMTEKASAEFLGQMQVVGISSDDAAMALARMAKSVNAAAKAQDEAADSGKVSDDVFTKFGISVRDNTGAFLPYETILQNVRDAHNSLSSGVEKTAMEMEIFGRSGYRMNAMLSQTKEQVAEIKQLMKDLGLTDINSEQLVEYEHQINKAHMALTSMASSLTEGSIPAVTEMIGQLVEMAKWLNANKEGISGVIEATGKFLSSIEVLILPLKKIVEFLKAWTEYHQAIANLQKSNQALIDVRAGKTFVPPSPVDESTKPSPTASAANAKVAKDRIDAGLDLQNKILELNNYTLRAKLNDIDREKLAWINKTHDEVSATKWAEAARAKAFEESQEKIDAGLKGYENSLKSVQSAREGVGSAFQGAFGSAISEVKENLKDSTKGLNAYDAVRKMKDDFELQKKATRAVAYEAGYSGEDIEKGMFDPITAQAQVSKAFEALAQAMAKADQDKIAYLKTIAQNTMPGQGGGTDPAKGPRAEGTVGIFTPQDAATIAKIIANAQAEFARSETVNISTTVNVNGMDAQSAQQLGEVAAQKIIPAVQQAVTTAQTQYGGGSK